MISWYTWSPTESFEDRKPVKAKYYWLKKFGKVILMALSVIIPICVLAFFWLISSADYLERLSNI